MGLLKTLLPTPGKIVFIILLFPLVLLLLIAVFSFVFAFTTFSLFVTLIISLILSYVLVSIIYQFVKAAVKVLIIMVVAGFLLSFLGLSMDPVKLTVNNVLNDHVNTMDASCVVDEECVVVPTDCAKCSGSDALEAANAEWERWCPLSYKEAELCEPLPTFNATCINNQCQIQDES